ncbi:MAG: peptidyl-prolyl cis-trans isomerase [Janthinobacterium lividum]
MTMRTGDASKAPRPWRRWLHEPMLHFMVLAAGLFALDAVLHPPDRTSHVITVTKAMRTAMSENFDEDRERPATPAELNAMVENWVASEILYREGKALGVDRGDDTIRDRIAFKLQLMIFSQLDAPVAHEQELRTWFAANHARFDEPDRVSFYLAPAGSEADARRQLEAIATGHEPDKLQQTTRAIIGRPINSLALSFGDEFRDKLLALPLEQWAVLQSREGWHVVRLDSRRPGTLARFEDMQDDVVRTWQTDETRSRAWEAVKRLRANYTVKFEE